MSGHMGAVSTFVSLSARRVWIEMAEEMEKLKSACGHSLRGECGLKYIRLRHLCNIHRHSLRGECGLKLVLAHRSFQARSGHSLRGECGLKSDDESDHG